MSSGEHMETSVIKQLSAVARTNAHHDRSHNCNSLAVRSVPAEALVGPIHSGPFIMSARPHGSLHGHKSILSVPGCCMKGKTRDRDVVKVLLRLSQCKFNIIHGEHRDKRAFMREQRTLAACDGAINAVYKHQQLHSCF